MDKVTIKFDVSPSDFSEPLGFEFWIDQTKHTDLEQVTEFQTISAEINDHSADHQLRFLLKNKKPQHTKIDLDGSILSDVTLTIENLEFDGIPLGHVFTDQAIYKHNFNQPGDYVNEKFYGTMGCNGEVCLTFFTPIHLWLLENM